MIFRFGIMAWLKSICFGLLFLVLILKEERRAVADVLLYVLDLLEEVEFVLLSELIQVDLIGQVDDSTALACRGSRRRFILFLLVVEVHNLLCKLFLKALQNVKGLEMPLVRLSLELGNGAAQEHLN